MTELGVQVCYLRGMKILREMGAVLRQLLDRAP